ncbi:MAG TPA: alkaline phosphatase [Negativicutes bacterium]|nr:alkaline phosphatase [Negativicutes bacterium]
MARFGKKLVIIAVLIAFAMLLASAATFAADKPAKNVIFLMTDGTSATHIALARWYKGAPLALDGILVGAVRTYSTESVITDSAPAATAFATGHKSNSKFLGILPELTTVPGVAPTARDEQYKPVATVLEGARLQGKSVGLVATSNIQHASPAAFSAHTPFRDRYELIAKQQAYGNIDVVFSAGKRFLLPQAAGGTRADGQNLVELLRSEGYAFVESRDQMLALAKGRVWGLFAAEAMQNDMDRKALAPQEPSLAEMTKKAIELLAQNDKGFFLFVEASKVDWAAHGNEPMGVISDLLAYDEAVRVALEFAARDGNTLVLACADHGTGGMAIGAKQIYNIYDKMPFARLIEPLKKADMTGEGVAALLDDRSESNIRLVLMQHYGLENLTDEEIAKIQKAGKGRALAAVIGPMLSARSAIGWIYTGHTGEDVFLYAFGPQRPSGLIENTQIAAITAKALGFDLGAADRELFVPAEEAFRALGATVAYDGSDESRPVLVVRKGLLKAELPIDTNRLIIGKTTYKLPGITVYIAHTKKTYVPKAAVELAKAAGF